MQDAQAKKIVAQAQVEVLDPKVQVQQDKALNGARRPAGLGTEPE